MPYTASDTNGIEFCPATQEVLIQESHMFSRPAFQLDIVRHILAWVPRTSVWKLRQLCRDVFDIITSHSFTAENLSHLVDAPGVETTKPSRWDVMFFYGPPVYQQVYARKYLSRCESIQWNNSAESLCTSRSPHATIPASLCLLTGLVKLNLRGCGLTGTLPSGIGRLKSLEVLNVSFNCLQGEIPVGLAKLELLQQLHLGHNKFSGQIPPELGNLRALTFLSLHDNQGLVGLLPAELGNLSELEHLNITNTCVSGPIPAEWGNMVNMKTLCMSRNPYLSSPIPPQLGNLALLTFLDLSRSSLTGSIPRELGRLSCLQSLSLKGNSLEGEVPGEIGTLGNLWNLKHCDLAQNRELKCTFRFQDHGRWLFL
ncbi:hypothetical protein HDU98_004376 [Podochytrium sp. JEL0797]|nr:hypothetical protein HDU98_004376 [Podochytrium sp. JEL0797]